MAFIYVLRDEHRGDVNTIRPTLRGMSNDEILKVTRLSRDAIEELTALIYNDMERQTRRSNALIVESQVLCVLQFLSSGSFQWMVGRSVVWYVTAS